MMEKNSHPIARTLLSIILIVCLISFVFVLSLSLTMNEEVVKIFLAEEIDRFVNQQIKNVFSEGADREEELQAEYTRLLEKCEFADMVTIGEGFYSLTIPCREIRDRPYNEFTVKLKEKVKERLGSIAHEKLILLQDIFLYIYLAVWILGSLSALLLVLIVVLAKGMPWINLGIVGIVPGALFIVVLLYAPLLLRYVGNIITKEFPVLNLTHEAIASVPDGVFALINDVAQFLLMGYLILLVAGIVFLVVGLFVRQQRQVRTAEEHLERKHRS